MWIIQNDDDLSIFSGYNLKKNAMVPTFISSRESGKICLYNTKEECLEALDELQANYATLSLTPYYLRIFLGE